MRKQTVEYVWASGLGEDGARYTLVNAGDCWRIEKLLHVQLVTRFAKSEKNEAWAEFAKYVHIWSVELDRTINGFEELFERHLEKARAVYGALVA